MATAYIRLRIVPVSPDVESTDSRETFWAPFRRRPGLNEGLPIAECERQLEFGLGLALEDRLREHLQQQMRDFERSVMGDGFRGPFWHDLPLRIDGKSPEVAVRAMSEWFRHRERLFRQFPGFQKHGDRLAAASLIGFSFRIARYGSLEGDIGIGSIKKLAEVCDGNFDYIEPLMRSLIHPAFAEVFDDAFASANRFEVAVPQRLRLRFKMLRQKARPASANVVAVAAPKQSEQQGWEKLTKGEKAWLFANASYVVPLLLTMVIFILGLRELRAASQDRVEAMKPLLEHYSQIANTAEKSASSQSEPSGPASGAAKSPGRAGK